MIKPFADDEGASAIGGLSVENGATRVVISGSVEIARDAQGLERARELKQLMDDLVAEIEMGGAPPQLAKTPQAAADEIENPFA